VTVNPTDPTPAYVQIANQLREAINRGDLTDGQQLPTQKELIEQSGAAPGTVQRAIAQLESEGLVIVRHGKGTFVRRPRRLQRDGSTRHLSQRRAPGAPPMRAEAESQNFEQKQFVVSARTEGAPLDVAGRLGLREGEPVLVRRFVLALNGEPVQTAASYFPDELADDPVLQAAEKVPGGTHAYLKQALGLPLRDASEDLIARMPTPDELKILRLAPGTPVVELLRTIYAADDRPVEVTVFLCAADRFEFTYRVPVD
jgi:GntR family transcriptional regulator